MSIQDVQNAEYNLFKSLDNLFRSNNIKYMIMCGTLLGSVRHKGFIPWDDDIDIGIFREDFEKAVELLEKKSDLSILVYDAKNHFYSYVPKIVDKSIILKDNASLDEKIVNPWIDLFPLDGLPDRKLTRNIHRFRITFAKILFNIAHFETNVDFKRKRPFSEKFVIYMISKLKIYKLFSKHKAFKRLDRTLAKFPPLSNNTMINGLGVYRSREIFSMENIVPLKEYRFDELVVYGPKDYDYVLSKIYGDYMKLPKIEDRHAHSLEEVGK